MRVAVKTRNIDMIMIESEGITENVKFWRTDMAAKLLAP